MKNSVLRTLFVLRTDPSAMFKIRIFDNFARFPDEICPKNNTETPAQTYSVLPVIKAMYFTIMWAFTVQSMLFIAIFSI